MRLPTGNSRKTGNGVEVTRHDSSVDVSWTTNTPAAWVGLLLTVVQTAVFIWLVNQWGLARWLLSLFTVYFVCNLVASVWRSFRDVVVHADADGLRVHEQHALGFSTSRHFARADLQQIFVHRQGRGSAVGRFKLVALVGPNSKKKLVARGLTSEAPALRAEAVLENFLLIAHESTGRLAEVPRLASPPAPRSEPTNPWESLPGDLSR